MAMNELSLLLENISSTVGSLVPTSQLDEEDPKRARSFCKRGA